MFDLLVFLFFVSIKAFKGINLVQFNEHVLRACWVPGGVPGRVPGRRGHKVCDTWFCDPTKSGEANGHR